MEILNLTYDIQILYNDQRSTYKKKEFLADIYANKQKGRIIINCGGDPGDNADVVFLYSQVTVPVTSNIDDLVTILRGYINNVRIAAGVYTLAIGTNVIPFANALPSSDYTPVVNDMDGVGFDAPSSLTANGFTILNAIGVGRISYHAIMN